MNEFKKLLTELVSIPSVSTDIAYRKDIEKALKWLDSYAKKSKLQVKIVRGFSNPIIIAKTKKDTALKTILIYGHYDVQPAKKSDGWKSNPFSLTQKNKRLYGRGSADNKGQILTHLYSVANLIKQKRLGYNITFLIEGNEETGSPLLRKFIEKYREDLKCDCVIISDGEIASEDTPALEASFRGSANIEVSMETAEDDMHSGLFGGVVPNAAEELTKLISKLHDKEKRAKVSGFYNGPLGKSSLNKKEIADLKHLTKTKIIFAKNRSEYENRTGLLPAIEVTGMSSGYTGEGFRNSIPSKAMAKINVRFGPTDNPQKLIRSLEKFMKENTPSYVNLKINRTDACSGTTLGMKNKFSKKAVNVLETVYKTKPVLKHSGGTLPIVNDFKEILGVPQVMIPLANEDCGMHSASENISLNCIKKGLEFSQKFFSK